MAIAWIRSLARRAVAMAGGRALLQRSTEAFWEKCRDNYLAASPEYYDHREKALRTLLAGLPRIDRALDQGCGDGRFSLVMAEYCGMVEGYDLSPGLIQHRRRAAERNATNIRFHVRELEDVPTNPPCHLVACMGVLNVGVVDEVKCARVLDHLRDATALGGYLLLIDTLSPGAARIVPRHHGYVANYRSESSYVAQVEARGFARLREEVLAGWNEGLVNKMFLFQRSGAILPIRGVAA